MSTHPDMFTCVGASGGPQTQLTAQEAQCFVAAGVSAPSHDLLCLIRIRFFPTQVWKHTEDESLLAWNSFKNSSCVSTRRRLLCRHLKTCFVQSGTFILGNHTVKAPSRNFKNGIFKWDMWKPHRYHSCEDIAVYV